MVLVDSFSKWVEVWAMSTTTAAKTIEKLRGAFAAYGLPEELVSDNEPQFVSQGFAEYLAVNKVKHTRTPPYHPASNGAAERLVQTTKKALLKQELEQKLTGVTISLQEGLDSCLLSYRNTPNSVTGDTPAELFLKREPRVKLTLQKPNFVADMREKQVTVKEQRDLSRAADRFFAVDDLVFVKTVRGEEVSWNDGVVQNVSPVTYLVRVDDQVRFTHADHIRARCDGISNPESAVPDCARPA